VGNDCPLVLFQSSNDDVVVVVDEEEEEEDQTHRYLQKEKDKSTLFTQSLVPFDPSFATREAIDEA
jgi:hypothetical protein